MVIFFIASCGSQAPLSKNHSLTVVARKGQSTFVPSHDHMFARNPESSAYSSQVTNES